MTNLPGKKLLNYASVGFFVVSLIAIAGTVSDPIKKQLIAAFAAIDEPPWTEYYTPTPRPTPTRTPTLRPTPTKTPTGTPTPVKTPFCSSSMVRDCIYGCLPNLSGGICKPAPTPLRTPTRTPTPVKTPYCSSLNQRDCSFGCTASLTGGYCKPAPTKTPTLTPRSTSTPIPTAYCSTTLQRECLYGCIANLSGGNCRPAPTRTPTPRPTSTQVVLATPFCSSFTTFDCAFGCIADLNGGHCKPAPTRTPTLRPTPTKTPAYIALATPYCSRFTTEDCLYGCIADLNGGHCKPSPTRTPTPRFTVNPYSYFTLPPSPTRTPAIYYYPTTRPTTTPLRTPTRIPTTASTTNGYSLSLIVNQTADPNRPGFNCAANPGVCPAGVEVSGFYRAPNGLYYPVAQSAGGPSITDLQYIQKNYEELKKTPTPTATPVSLAQLFGSNGSTNLFTGRTPSPTPFDIVTFMNTITMGPPKPTPTRTPTSLAGGPSLNQTVGNNSLNTFVSNTGAALSSALTNLLSYLNTYNQTPKPIPTTTTLSNSEKFSCATGYILKTNQFGAAYCQEDPKTWDSDEYVLRCRDDGSCSKCTTGFLSSCTTIPSIEAKSTQTAVQVIATTKGLKSLGSSCSSGSECQSGNCAKSWINSDGSRSVALTNRCVYSQSEQNAFTAAADKRETETVAYTAAGLAIPTAVVALPGAATTAYTTYGQLATGTLPALAQASVNVVSQIVPAVTVGGLTYGAGDCAFGYAGGEACKIAGELALTGYTADPIGFTQMFQQVGQLPSTIKNTVTAIRNVTRTTTEVSTLESGVVYDAVTGQATTFRPDSSKIIDLDFLPDEIIPPLPANVSNTSQLLTSGTNNSTAALQLTGPTINSGALVLPAINPTTAITNPIWTALTVAVTTPLKNITVNSLSTVTAPLSIAQTSQQIPRPQNSISGDNISPENSVPAQVPDSTQTSSGNTVNIGNNTTFNNTNTIPVTPTTAQTSDNAAQIIPSTGGSQEGGAIESIRKRITETVNKIANVILPKPDTTVTAPPLTTTQKDTGIIAVENAGSVNPITVSQGATTETERRIELVIQKTDDYLTRTLGEPNELGCRSGVCDLSAGYVSTASYEVGLTPKIYGVEELNALRGIPVENTFGHYVTVLENPATGQLYLVDRTFNQFVDPETHSIRNTNNKRFISSGSLDDHPLAKEMIDRGYVELTDETLNEYLDMVSNVAAPKPASITQLDDAKPIIERPYSPQEIERLVPELGDLRSLAANPPQNQVANTESILDKYVLNPIKNIINPNTPNTVSQQLNDKISPIITETDSLALGWWKPSDFEPPALTEPQIPVIPVVQKPVPEFDEGSKFFDTYEYPQLKILPGDQIRTSKGRTSTPVYIPQDGQLIYVQVPGKGYVQQNANIFVRINNSPAAPTPLIKMPYDGMVINTKDRVQVYQVEKLAESGNVTVQNEYLMGTISTPSTTSINIERNPDIVYFNPGDNFITSGVSTVLRSPADVVAYGFLGHYPLAETIWQWTDAYNELTNAINSGAVVLTGGDGAAEAGMQVWQSVTGGPGKLVPTEKPGLIPQAIEKIKSWIIPDSASSISITTTSNDDELNALVTRINNAFENAGAPNGIGCRTELCETASGYVKIDADNSGLVVNNYNVAQANGLRGGDSSTLVTHEFSIAFNNNGEPQAIIDLTIPQFTYIDFTDPLAKEMLEKGYVKYTTENFNHYLDLIGNKPLQAVDDTILNKLNSHQPYISEDRKQQYLQKGLIDLTPEKSPEAPEKVWTPVPDWEDKPVLPSDNEIFVISPDVQPGERFVETLKGSGWTPTNFNTDIVARVIDGTLNVPVNFAASTLGNDLADAITWGFNCGFRNIAISCNTAQLPEVIDVVWPLLPQQVKENVQLLTTFDAIEKAYQGKTLPLVIGTTPTANSLAQNAKLPTLISEGQPAVQDKVQRLIWLEKRAQGSILPTGPTDIQSMTPEDARQLADSLADEIIADLKNIGTKEVVVACTDITTLCARKDAGINFRDPAEFIRPPGVPNVPADNNMQVWQETTIQVQPNFPTTTTTIQDIKTKIQNTIHNSIYNGPLGDKLFGNVSVDLFDPVSKSVVEGVGVKVRDLDTLSPTDPKLSPLQQAIVKDLLDHGTVVYVAHVPSLKFKSYAHGLDEHGAAAVAGAPFVNLNNILISNNVLNNSDFFPFALEHELGHFNTTTQYREALTARQQVEDEISANQSAIDAMEKKFAVVDGDPAMKIAEERLESDLAWLQKLQDNPSLDPILTEIKKGEFSVGNQGIVYHGVYTRVTEIKPDTLITVLPNDIVATNDYLIIPTPNQPNTETIYWRQLDKNGKSIPSLPLQKLESEGITLDLKQYGGFEIGIKDAEGMLYYPDTLAWSSPPKNSKNYRPLNNIAIFDPNYRPVIVRQSDAANSSQTLQGKIRNAISDLISSINEMVK